VADNQHEYDELVPERQARRELGNVSVMTFWRWDTRPETAPPGWERAIKVGSRNTRSRRMLETVKANLARAARGRGRAA
jgi:hypothetical protein